MLDIKFIREHSDQVKQAIRNKGETADIDRLIYLDSNKREQLAKVEELKHRKNVVSKEIGQKKKTGQDAGVVTLEMKKVGTEIKHIDSEISSIEKEMRDILDWIPNIPHSSVPIGDETANLELKSWGDKPEFDFTPKPHWELGEQLGILGFDKAARLSGSNFVLYCDLGAKLERALIILC